jgi:hypothetical protein
MRRNDAGGRTPWLNYISFSPGEGECGGSKSDFGTPTTLRTLSKRDTLANMGRRRQERRKLAEHRWPLLSNLMACHFNQDYNILYGSLEGAIIAALQDGSLDHRRAVLKEWRDWQETEGTVNDIRPFLDDGFSVDIWFAEPADARKLMNRIYDGLMEGVKAETRHKG